MPLELDDGDGDDVVVPIGGVEPDDGECGDVNVPEQRYSQGSLVADSTNVTGVNKMKGISE